MADKKVSSSYVNVLNQILAQFDLDTKVRGIATEAFQGLLKSNSQAFQFIAESQKKLVNFQTRLHKVESMHQSVYIGVNNKMQVTQQLKSQFQSFVHISNNLQTVEFWGRIKENVQENAELKRKVDSLTIQQKKQGQQIQKSTKDLSRFNFVTTSLDQKIDQQVHRVMLSMSVDFQKTNDQLQQRRQQIEKLIERISQSKALLDSKSKLVDELLEDLGLYKFEKKDIEIKLNHLFDEITMRIHKSQFYQMRKYFDGVIQEEKVRNQDRFAKHWHVISENREQVDKQNKNIYNVIRNLREQTQNSFLKMNSQSLQRYNETCQSIQKCKCQLQGKLADLQKMQSEKILTSLNRIIQLEITTKKHVNDIQRLQQLTKKHSQHLNQAESNIISINERITGIQKENLRRQIQLGKLQQNSESSGDLQSKIKNLTQNIRQIKDVLNNAQEIITENFRQFTKNKRETNLSLQQLQKSVQDNRKGIDKRLQETHQSIKQSFEILDSKIIETKSESLKHTDDAINNIQSKLDNLDDVSKSINDFKDIFEKQLVETDYVNKNVKEKIQSLSSALVKQKSDISIRIDRLVKQIQKRGDTIKNIEKNIQDFKGYFSQVSQTLSICICSELWGASLTQPLYQAFKVSSIRDGWILQIEGKQKIRYRGQYLPRTKILELAIDNFIKVNDKLKGTIIIESGKQTFQKIIAGNADIGAKTGRLSRRSVSRRRQSQLPKLYK